MYENLNLNLMTENVKGERLGVVPQVDLCGDLPRKPDYTIDSWFVIGRVEEAGHKINYLFHIMAMHPPIPVERIAKKWQVCFSVMDETTGYYHAGDHFYGEKEIQAEENYFSLKCPNAEMSGDWDKMKIYLKEKEFVIDTEATAIHYPVFTRGSSVFDVFGMVVHQMSIPYMKTVGTLTVKGRTYELNGENATSWFDRQWQKQNFKIKTAWSWMAIYLDNGEVLSVFDAEGETDTPRFMTVLRNDGSLSHSTNFKPLAEAQTRTWTSKASGNTYATRWDLNLYDYDSTLHVEPVVEQQEIKSDMNKLSKYEGSATVTGTFEGKPVTGRATIEIIMI
ncbi:MAG: hypothetical protein LUE89_09045 [Clostridiales bacterium]|nr:hypothetical protein [Clostridiales bacterium]